MESDVTYAVITSALYEGRPELHVLIVMDEDKGTAVALAKEAKTSARAQMKKQFSSGGACIR